MLSTLLSVNEPGLGWTTFKIMLWTWSSKYGVEWLVKKLGSFVMGLCFWQVVGPTYFYSSAKCLFLFKEITDTIYHEYFLNYDYLEVRNQLLNQEFCQNLYWRVLTPNTRAHTPNLKIFKLRNWYKPSSLYVYLQFCF